MKIFFILNPTRPRRLPALRTMALQIARRYHHIPQVGEVDRRLPHSMDGLLDQAIAAGCTRLIAVGGDGTYNRLIRLLGARNLLGSMEVGLVPAGTCNDFVRIWPSRSRRISEAIRLACTGAAIATDLGELNGEIFLNNAGYGRRSSAVQRRKVNAFRSLRQFEPSRLHVTWEQGSMEGFFYMGLVCNGPFFSKGLFFSKAVVLDDGWLDIFLVPKMAKAKLAAILLLGRLGRALRSRQIITMRLKEVTIEAERDLWPQIDGEPSAPDSVRRLHFKIAPVKALIVRRR